MSKIWYYTRKDGSKIPMSGMGMDFILKLIKQYRFTEFGLALFDELERRDEQHKMYKNSEQYDSKRERIIGTSAQ